MCSNSFQQYIVFQKTVSFIFGFCWLIVTIPTLFQSEKIRAHRWNRIFHLTLAALPHYLIKNCAVSINITYIFLPKKGTEHLNKPIAQNKSNTVSVSEFIWCAWNDCHSRERMLDTFYTITSWMDNFQVRTAPALNQPLFQFIINRQTDTQTDRDRQTWVKT